MFEYRPIDFDGFVVKPSSIATFMDNPKAWYTTHITKENVFQGNTSTVLGSIVHGFIEAHYTGKEITKEDVTEFLKQYEDNQDVDEWKILDSYEHMVKQWKKLYVPPAFEPKLIESQIKFTPRDGFCIGGSIDALFGDTLVDWKTTTSKKSSIGDYKYQLLTYAYILRKTGVEVNNIQVVYMNTPEFNRVSEKTGKELADIVTEVRVITEPIKDEDIAMIEELLREIVGTVKQYKKTPNLAKWLFRENKLSYRRN